MRSNKSTKSANKKQLLKFITCGSIDDGKSTLIGRLLYETNSICNDQFEDLKTKSFNNKNVLDLSYAVDGLSAEREQGITIDVAYRFFSTNKKKFVVIDAPGHLQYTKNMVTGVSNASIALILVDSRKGVIDQTYRHTVICHILGIRKVILLINKMDLIKYNKEKYYKIKNSFLKLVEKFSFDEVLSIPISALSGDNITKNSNKMKWFEGNNLLEQLENITLISQKKIKDSSIFSVQLVNRPDSNFRGYCGKVLSGVLTKGQKVLVHPDKISASIKNIWSGFNKSPKANVGDNVTLELKEDIDISRGNIITSENTDIEYSNMFQATIVWFSNKPAYAGRSYLLKINNKEIKCEINTIKYLTDITSDKKLYSKKIQINDIAKIQICTDEAINFLAYNKSKELGSFILIDILNYETLGCGMIEFQLRRSNNLHFQTFDINKSKRQELYGHLSKVLWFTGLSGSGKSTIANELAKELHKLGIHTYILDGDNIRHGLNKDLNFSDEDRIENIRRIAEVSKLFFDAGIVVITSFISPFKKDREMARNLFDEGDFIEIFCDTPIEICKKRDPKGLYKKAEKGLIPNFTGIDSIYEKPKNPEINLNYRYSVKSQVEFILKHLKLFLIN